MSTSGPILPPMLQRLLAAQPVCGRATYCNPARAQYRADFEGPSDCNLMLERCSVAGPGVRPRAARGLCQLPSLMSAPAMMPPNLAVSASTNDLYSARLIGLGTIPCAFSLFASVSPVSALLEMALSLVRIGVGVPAGANMPNQLSSS